MSRQSSRSIWLTLAAGCGLLVMASIVLTMWLHLHPCYLCISQRVLFMLLALAALAAGLAMTRRWRMPSALVFLVSALLGAGAAGYQIWLQYLPEAKYSCTGTGVPNLVEVTVDWLGERIPLLFLADGDCTDKALEILGISLAGWSLLAFAACLVLGLVALLRR